MATNTQFPTQPTWENWDAFYEWFWTSKNGHELIHKLNESTERTSDFIRRERVGSKPVIYAIVLNKPGCGGLKDWKFCKVGLTHVETTKETGNRMETVRRLVEIEYPNGKPSVLFVLPVNAVDSTPYHKTESRIRSQFGLKVNEELAKKLYLPVKTEWVLTTQVFIDKVKIEKGKKNADTGIFKTIKFDFEKCAETNPLPEWLQADKSKATVDLKPGKAIPLKAEVDTSTKK